MSEPNAENASEEQREELIEQFGEEKVERMDWWQEEMNNLHAVQMNLLDAVLEREDVQIMKRGRSAKTDGRHEITFKLRVAGNPLEGHDDD